jgi:hypothetical protein
MEKCINLHKYFSMENIFKISDASLLLYLSNVCSLKYILELQFIKRDDITENYNNIFESMDKRINNIQLIMILKKLKEEYENSFKSVINNKPINYNECYGC